MLNCFSHVYCLGHLSLFQAKKETYMGIINTRDVNIVMQTGI